MNEHESGQAGEGHVSTVGAVANPDHSPTSRGNGVDAIDQANLNAQQGALVSSDLLNTRQDAEGFSLVLQENPEDIKPFVPALWGGKALDVLSDEEKVDAKNRFKHLSPVIDRAQPVTVTSIDKIYEVKECGDGYFVVIFVGAINFTPLKTEAPETATAAGESATDHTAEEMGVIAE